ncbi:MAG: peptidase S16 [Rhodospirillaceae bacterium]|jgi:uncharacterized protein|nr:peptidase S16 [Rhodospirillaceae bacterium]MBT7955821.1 peptidase S16 [Rhodospirillaceae bacterium]
MAQAQGDPFGLPVEDLPQILPIFPLPGAMLLPHGRMPLNIFEPRYLNMVLNSLKEDRLIGMVQPLEMLPDPVPVATELFHIGCAGRIVAFAESEDGRILMTLQGVCRFKIINELDSPHDYRIVEPEYASFKDDLNFDNPAINRDSLQAILKDYLELKGIKIDWEGLAKADDRFLIATLGMMNPFDYREKQAILEARDIVDMVDVMTSLMEMELASGGDAPTKH